jgi:hypothetical protein
MQCRAPAGIAVTQGFAFGGAAYMVGSTSGLHTGFDPQRIFVFKSSDAGATWVIQDPTNSPQKSLLHTQAGDTCGSVLHGTTLTVAYATVDVVGIVTGTVRFRDYNLLTDTWGSDYGVAGGPTVLVVNQCFLRNDGSLLVLHNNGTTFSTVMYSVFAGGVWSAPASATVNLTIASASGVSSAVRDPATDTIHVLMYAGTAGTAKLFYQQILSTNALGNFHNFLHTDTAGNFVSGFTIYGTNLVFGAFKSGIPVVLSGTPLSNPVWSISGTIDAGFNLALPTPPIAFTIFARDSTTLWGVIAGNLSGSPFTGSIRIVKTTNVNPLLGWTLSDVVAAGFPGPNSTPSNAIMFDSGGVQPSFVYEDVPPDYTGTPVSFNPTMWASILLGAPPAPVLLYLKADGLPPTILPDPSKDC